MKTIFSLFLLLCSLAFAQAQKLSKFAEVDFNHSVRIKGAFSPKYGGCLAIGNFQSLMVPPVNGQTISYGNIAIAKPDGSLIRLDNGLPEETTAGCIIGEEIYAGTISGAVYKYTPTTGWNLLFSANAQLYNIVDMGFPNMLFVGEFTSINGSSYQYIARYNAQNETLDSVNGYLPSPLDESQIVTTSTTAYITWMNTNGTGSGLYALDKQTFTLTAILNPATNKGQALIANGNDVYFAGIDVNNNERRVWKIEPSGTTTELFTLLGGGPAISGLSVHNGNLYFVGYFSGTSTSQNVQNTGVHNLTTGVTSFWQATNDNIPLIDLIATADGNLLASTGYALYSTAQITTSIADPAATTTLIFPNPVSTLLHVTTDAWTPLVITNMNGQKLFESGKTNNHTTIIDVSNYPSGIYILNGKRFLIQH